MKKFILFLFILASYMQITSANEENTIFTTQEEQIFMCTMEYSPVCGNDGQTYGNACSAQKVGVKYNGTCIGNNLEKNVENAWTKAINKNLSGKSDETSVNILENVITRAEKLLSKYDFESKNYGVLNYITTLAKNSLQKDVYEKFIKNNISKLSPIDPVLGGKWYVTKITWIDLNVAKIEYEDGHIVENLKIKLEVKNNKIEATNLEKILEIKEKFNSKDLTVKLKVPTSWEGKYKYDFLNKNVLQFTFISKDEGENMLFNLNLHTNAEWKKIEKEGLFNITKLFTTGDFVVSTSNSLDVPFIKQENISEYIKMIEESKEVIESVDVILK